jgi:hypothetical protein
MRTSFLDYTQHFGASWYAYKIVHTMFGYGSTMRYGVAIVLFAASLNAAEVEPWTLERLDLEVRISADPIRVIVRGRERVRLEAERSNGPTFGINSDEAVMSLTRLWSGDVNAEIGPYREGSPLIAASLKFPREFTKGATLDVEFEAQGDQQASQFVWTRDGAYGSWVESWYPRPALGPTELASPRAPGTTSFRMPPGWRSVSNGTLIARDDAVETWSTDIPAARSFVAAPFAAVEETNTIAIYQLKARSQVRAQAEILAKAIAAMERRFGAYPYPSYSIVEVPESANFAAASEQGFIMVRSSLLDAPSGNLPLFAHEAAHGWWGNLVRPDGPGSQMLSEALAQYSMVVAIEMIEGEEAAARFVRYSRENYNPIQCALGYFYIVRQGGDRPLSQMSTARWDHNLSDSKGMWFYRMLRDRIGDEKFFGVLRTIIRDYASRRISLSRFREIVTLADPGIGPFLAQWLDRDGAPVITADWWSVDRGRGAEVRVSQHQGSAPFDVDLDLLVETESGVPARTTMRLCERSQTVFVPTTSRPIGVRLDPDDRLLIWRPEYGAPPEGLPARH